MEKLNYRTLEKLKYKGYILKDAPERVLQFGEGNFLRAFVEHFIDIMNEKAEFNGKVVMVQPSPNNSATYADKINEQDGLYTLYLRGLKKGGKVQEKRIISCVSRCLNVNRDYSEVIACADNPELRYIVCNTTEAGIVHDSRDDFKDFPPVSYPAKLTQFLYRRFQRFGEKNGKGFIILPCELIDDNGKELKRCVLKYAVQWRLGEEFIQWIERENLFCSTLVDRIVTGYPKDEAVALNEENGYEDSFIDTGEMYGMWVIEAPEWLSKELPFDEAGLPVQITNDYKPYRQRKVCILNGAHTSMAPGAYLAGKRTVGECMDDKGISEFIKRLINNEIIPALSLCEEECKQFADAVEERFENPFIHHELLSISLNSTSKWKARVLPVIEDYQRKYGVLPRRLVASFAFYIAFYIMFAQGSCNDERKVLEFFCNHRDDSEEELVHAVCCNAGFWGKNLAKFPGLEEETVRILRNVRKDGIYETIVNLI
ncbi:hypothetical protein C818_00927 [Lachnospiraceae bacterium MD308]|nr:hypothetical protein C818_00927 [Lachnospiraceae bacterium MD308]MCI8502340.1 tagaturonate reductase [Dorea sp.]